jgi:hypothetical protein
MNLNAEKHRRNGETPGKNQVALFSFSGYIDSTLFIF